MFEVLIFTPKQYELGPSETQSMAGSQAFALQTRYWLRLVRCLVALQNKRKPLSRVYAARLQLSID